MVGDSHPNRAFRLAGERHHHDPTAKAGHHHHHPAPRDDHDQGADAQLRPSYPDFCIRPPPPDLDCPEIGETDCTVQGTDPHGFDGDNDGVGCQS